MPNEPSEREKIDPKLRAALRSCCDGMEPWPLFVFGPVGTGKTCAGLRAFRCYGGWFVTLSALCELFNEAREHRLRYSSGAERTTADLRAAIKLSHILVVDEAGKREKPSPHRYDVLDDLVNARWEHNPPLIVISNMEPSVLATQYDDRIVSRLTRGTVVELTGPDRRIERKE